MSQIHQKIGRILTPEKSLVVGINDSESEGREYKKPEINLQTC